MVRLAIATLVIVGVLLGPIFSQAIEGNLELFFLLVGVLTTCIMGQLSAALVWAALSEPLSFTLAVLVFGAIFRLLRDYLDQLFRRVIRLLDPRLLCFCLVILLGFLAAFRLYPFLCSWKQFACFVVNDGSKLPRRYLRVSRSVSVQA